MSIKNLKAFKAVTKVGAPVEKTVKWTVEATAENIEFLKTVNEKEIELGDQVELEGQVFIKKLSFEDQGEITKAYEWDLDKENIENSKLKAINTNQLQAAQMLGTICEDVKGTPFFKDVSEVKESDSAFINALYAVSDDINNFLGKSRKKNLSETNSGVNLSSTESVETPLKKPRKK